ncbi:MAG: DUF6334 family protein [Bacteroidia bacterium]
MIDYSEIILPQKIKGIKLSNLEFYNLEGSFEKISIILEFQVIDFTPLIDTDEIDIQINSNKDVEDYFISENFEKYVNKEILTFWKCVNSQGYFDLFIFSIDSLTPTFSILSEGSSLKVIT